MSDSTSTTHPSLAARLRAQGRARLGRTRRFLVRRIAPADTAAVRELGLFDARFGTGRGQAIDRRLIDDFLSRAAQSVTDTAGSGTVLEIGETRYARKIVPNHRPVVLDYEPGVQIHGELPGNLRGDLECGVALAGGHGHVNMGVVTQTLFTLRSPLAGLTTIAEILRPGGLLFGTEPFLMPTSLADRDAWGDRWRLTKEGLREMLRLAGMEVYTCRPLGNAMLSAASCMGLCVEDVPNEWFEAASETNYVLTGYVARKRAA